MLTDSQHVINYAYQIIDNLLNREILNTIGYSFCSDCLQNAHSIDTLFANRTLD